MPALSWRPGETAWLTAGGHRLEGLCLGPAPAAAPTIVMLHEGLGCVALWRDFPHQLAAATDCGVFAYSRAGYGQSDPAPLPRPLDYMTREAVDVLPEVLDAVGLQRGILLGHSDGATIAAIHGGTVADPRVRGLVLMAPHFFTEPGGLAEIARARVAFEAEGLRERLARYHRDPDNAFRGWNDAWLAPEFEHWNVAAVIDTIAVPVLAVQGQDDQYGTQAQIDAIARRLGANAETSLLAACKHAPHIDQPQRTLDAISQFIAGSVFVGAKR